jgi:hypothetical protein
VDRAIIYATVLYESDSSFVLVYEQIGGPDSEVVYQDLKAAECVIPSPSRVESSAPILQLPYSTV